jgi:hypothetical protein
MNQEIQKILSALNIQPVLVDVGASGVPPAVWDPIAKKSIYLGFDPDRRELHDIPDGQYSRSIIVNEAITAAESDKVSFYLTRSPYCSSTLPPDTEALSDYIFSDDFTVENQVSVAASTLNAVIDRLSLQHLDWFKADSQGTDLRLFQSLRDDLRKSVIAVDIEPGLIDAYIGEDLFVDSHKALLKEGFWLSSLDIKGTVRMKRDTLDKLSGSGYPLREIDVHKSVRLSPGWCEARYLRTLDSLVAEEKGQRDYILLWVFAIIEKHWGFALDIASGYEERFGRDSILSQLYNLPLQQINLRNTGLRGIIKKVLPNPVKEFLGRLVKR